MSGRLRLHFGAFQQSIEFVDCPDMAAGFRSILRGWQISEVDDSTHTPFISFRREDGRYLWLSDFFPTPSDWRDKAPRTAEQAVYEFHYYFFDWFVANYPNMFCLHAACIDFPSGLATFPSIQRAGKSTFATELARRGLTVFCDDVLPVEVEGHRGMALGILPRLRLPLPSDASAEYRAFVAERQAMSSKRWAYLALKDHELAPFGTTREIGAVVILERSAKSRKADLAELPMATAVARVIDRNFAKQIPPATIFDALYDLVSKVRRLHLRYSNVEDAAQVLIQELGGPPAEV